jgi:hypothetical protein
VRAAERLLDLFSGEIDADWRDAILLTIAWFAAPSAPAEAARVRDQIRASQPGSPTVTRLLERLTAALDGVPVPPAPLPPEPMPEEAALIVARIAGSGNSSLLAHIDDPLIDRILQDGTIPAEGAYLSALDGPRLVAIAAEQPSWGDRWLGRYLEAHRVYEYPQYRDGSLWELLGAVLLHPEQDWVRDWLARMSLVVLAAPNRGEFLEGLEIAVLALQANAGDPDAIDELAARRDTAVEQAEARPPSPVRGKGMCGRCIGGGWRPWPRHTASSPPAPLTPPSWRPGRWPWDRGLPVSQRRPVSPWPRPHRWPRPTTPSWSSAPWMPPNVQPITSRTSPSAPAPRREWPRCASGGGPRLRWTRPKLPQ